MPHASVLSSAKFAALIVAREWLLSGGRGKIVVPCCAKGVGSQDGESHGDLSISRHYPTSPGLGGRG
jgi:hypothetical protein